VIATPPGPIPAVVEALGKWGTRGIVVLSAIPRDGSAGTTSGIEAAILEAAGRHLIRILSPSCLGLLVPGMRSRGIGFSHFVSLGNSADVDVGDLLDYLGGDAATQAIPFHDAPYRRDPAPESDDSP